MTTETRNARWARLIAEETRRGGAGLAVLCPGSRNSPLVFALATVFGDAAVSHIDERSAGFLALGYIRATGQPAVVCVTSGSAVANLLPALVEAHADRLPLIVITADRPWEAIGCGAPQALRQEGLLRPGVVREVFLGEPSDDDLALRSLRREVSRLVQTPGPGHLNVPLRENPPAASTKGLSDLALHGRAKDAPFTDVCAPSHAGLLTTPEWWRAGQCGLIIVGPGPAPVGVMALAHRTGYPVLADAASSLRHEEPMVLALADALVGGVLGQERPDVVLLISSQPTTRALYEFVARQADHLITASAVGTIDAHARADLAIEGEDAVARLAAIAPGLGDPAWTARWRAAEQAARRRLAAAIPTLPWGEAVAVAAAVNHPVPRFLFLASSMAIRHANLLLAPTARPVLANRGVNGIDGTLGSFLGAGRALGPGLLVIGDLAFLHDLPALAAGGVGAIVLLNNGGGAIFDYLPVAQVPDYQRWIRTSHTRTFAAAADLFGLVYHGVQDRAALDAALATVGDGRLHLIECHLQGLDAVGEHRRLLRIARGEEESP